MSPGQFETVTEWRDAGRLRALHFSRHSVMDAQVDLRLTYDAAGKLQSAEWKVTGDWDWAQLSWRLNARGQTLSVRAQGRSEGQTYDRPLVPRLFPLPAALRFRPSLPAYQRLNCTPLSWPTP